MIRFLLLAMLGLGAWAYGEVPSKEWQIKTALLAAPEEERERSTVLGYDAEGRLTTLKEGDGQLICLADDPARDGFSVSCYYAELEPYMEFGRGLREKGMGFREVFDAREDAVKSGELEMPDRSILYVLSGDVDASTGEVSNTYLRYVIYIPYATVESTGIPLQPLGPGAPWIMDPGTHRAHIMINPPR